MCAAAMAGPCADTGLDGETTSSPVGEKGRWSSFSCWSMITSTKDTEGRNALVFFVGGGGDGAIDLCLVFRFFDGFFVKVVIDGNSSLFRLNLAGMTSASDGSIGLIVEGVFFLIVLVGIGEFYQSIGSRKISESCAQIMRPWWGSINGNVNDLNIGESVNRSTWY